MKKLILALFLLLALPASAQTPTPTPRPLTITVPLSSQRAAQLDRAVDRRNARTCASVQLPPTCTNAQAQAINPNLTIFSNRDALQAEGVVDITNRTGVEQRAITLNEIGETLDTMTRNELGQVCVRLNAKDPVKWPSATNCWP